MKLHTEKCIGCKYWRKSSGIAMCHYSIDNDVLRGCEAKFCDKRDTGKYSKKKDISFGKKGA